MKMSANLSITMNDTEISSCYNPTAQNIGQTFIYCFIFIVSLAGNIFIGIIFYKKKTMRKPINFLIVNMAMSDLLLPIFLFPRLLTDLYVGSWLISGPLGQALCKLDSFLPDVSIIVSIQSLVLIAVDRFGAVVCPLRSPLISSKLCPFFILATWIVAIATCSPYLISFKLVRYPERLVCEPRMNTAIGDHSSFEKYVLVITVVYLFTLLVLIVTYSIIFVKLKLHTVPGEQSAIARQQRVKRERNVLKMAIAIVLGFAACYLPNCIMLFLILFESSLLNLRSCRFQYFSFVALSLAQANCAINPWICLTSSGNYRRALKKLLRCF